MTAYIKKSIVNMTSHQDHRHTCQPETWDDAFRSGDKAALKHQEPACQKGKTYIFIVKRKQCPQTHTCSNDRPSSIQVMIFSEITTSWDCVEKAIASERFLCWSPKQIQITELWNIHKSQLLMHYCSNVCIKMIETDTKDNYNVTKVFYVT